MTPTKTLPPLTDPEAGVLVHLIDWYRGTFAAIPVEAHPGWSPWLASLTGKGLLLPVCGKSHLLRLTEEAGAALTQWRVDRARERPGQHVSLAAALVTIDAGD